MYVENPHPPSSHSHAHTHTPSLLPSLLPATQPTTCVSLVPYLARACLDRRTWYSAVQSPRGRQPQGRSARARALHRHFSHCTPALYHHHHQQQQHHCARRQQQQQHSSCLWRQQMLGLCGCGRMQRCTAGRSQGSGVVGLKAKGTHDSV